MRRCRTKNWRQLCDVWELEQAAVRVDSSFIHDAHDIGCCVPVSADSGHTIIRQFFSSIFSQPQQELAESDDGPVEYFTAINAEFELKKSKFN